MSSEYNILMNIQPGRSWIVLKQDTNKQVLMKSINDWYITRTWIPIIRKYLYDLYGEDVAQIIMFYYDNIECEGVLL